MSKHNKNHNQPSHSQPDTVRMRLDKWLWAARFYRTRTLAKEAIESGRVHYAGSRVKTSKEIAIGDELSIRQGSATAMTEKTVIVEANKALRNFEQLLETRKTSGFTRKFRSEKNCLCTSNFAQKMPVL